MTIDIGMMKQMIGRFMDRKSKEWLAKQSQSWYWHSWFAWFPVKAVNDHYPKRIPFEIEYKLIWLKRVWRSRYGNTGGYSWWVYRTSRYHMLENMK